MSTVIAPPRIRDELLEILSQGRDVDELLDRAAEASARRIEAKLPPHIRHSLRRSYELADRGPTNARTTGPKTVNNSFSRADSTFNNLFAKLYVGAWVYPTDVCANGCAIVCSPFVTRIPFCLGYGNEVGGGAQSFWSGFYTGTAWQNTIGNGLTLNVWNYVAYQMWDANNWGLRSYYGVNGGPVGEGNSNQTGVANAAAGAGGVLTVGRRWDAGNATPNFPGYIAEVALWNNVFTDSTQWRHAQALGYGVSPLSLGRPNLVGYWPLMGALAATEVDLSGNGRHLSQVGTCPTSPLHPPVNRSFAAISRRV
jgi:hypothetical protein